MGDGGGIGVNVGETGVLVGGNDVLVGGSDVKVGGTGVLLFPPLLLRRVFVGMIGWRVLVGVTVEVDVGVAVGARAISGFSKGTGKVVE